MSEFERKITIAPKSTDILKDFTGKSIKVNSGYEVQRNVQFITRAGEAERKAILKDDSLTDEEKMEKIQESVDQENDKTMIQVIGKEAWEEAKAFLESSENYNQNRNVFFAEVMSLSRGEDFEVVMARFQRASAK